jgi:hypothetical protein
MKILVQLIHCLIILIFLTSCSTRDTKKDITIENNQFIDSLNNQVASLHIDSIDINQLINSKWSQIVAEDCITYIMFNKDGTYKEDNCEWDLTFEGIYKISKDTIFLKKYDLASNLPDEYQIVNKAVYTYIYKIDSLLFISNQQIEDGKVVSTYIPEIPIYYKKEK